MRKLIIQKNHTVIASPEVIAEVAITIDAVEKKGIWVHRIDKAIGKIVSKQEHNALMQDAQIIKD